MCDATPSASTGPRSMRVVHQRGMILRLLVVVAVAGLVHGSGHAADAVAGNAALPFPVAETRDLLLSAVRSGRIEDLRPAIDDNTIPPDLGLGSNSDVIAALKSASADGEGREALAALAEILDLPPATLPLGKDLENNLIYVWPYLAETPLDQLTPQQQVDLYRLVPAAKATEMREKKRWLWWRLVVGADGSWHAFKKAE
jgi:hypothetical protein